MATSTTAVLRLRRRDLETLRRYMEYWYAFTPAVAPLTDSPEAAPLIAMLKKIEEESWEAEREDTSWGADWDWVLIPVSVAWWELLVGVVKQQLAAYDYGWKSKARDITERILAALNDLGLAVLIAEAS